MTERWPRARHPRHRTSPVPLTEASPTFSNGCWTRASSSPPWTPRASPASTGGRRPGPVVERRPRRPPRGEPTVARSAGRAHSRRRRTAAAGTDEGEAPLMATAPAPAHAVCVFAVRRGRGPELPPELVPAGGYSEEALRERLSEPATLERCVRDHHAVVTAFPARGGAIPLPPATLCHSEERCRAALLADVPRFERTLERITGRNEWAVKGNPLAGRTQRAPSTRPSCSIVPPARSRTPQCVTDRTAPRSSAATVPRA